jgi:sulfite exporter TauE/SafE
MSPEFIALLFSAITISFLHTASGPDHYLPFIVLWKSHSWSKARLIFLTVICGLGHVLSSVLLGCIGILLGWQMAKLDWFQDYRGIISSWSLLAFGLVYLCWGIYQAYRNKPHKHFDVMGDDVYVYEHKHGEVVYPQKRVKVTPFVLLAIFVMGPSEPIIPLLFYSGAKHSIAEIIILVSVFTIFTVLTMLTMVLIGVFGFSYFNTERLERYVHVIGGCVVTCCGIGMVFWGW